MAEKESFETVRSARLPLFLLFPLSSVFSSSAHKLSLPLSLARFHATFHFPLQVADMLETTDVPQTVIGLPVTPATVSVLGGYFSTAALAIVSNYFIKG